MATVRTFDTFGYASFLASKGIEAKTAEALTDANHEFLINNLATKDFVHTEVTASENRIVKSVGRMLAVAVAAILVSIPIVMAIVQKLG